MSLVADIGIRTLSQPSFILSVICIFILFSSVHQGSNQAGGFRSCSTVQLGREVGTPPCCLLHRTPPPLTTPSSEGSSSPLVTQEDNTEGTSHHRTVPFCFNLARQPDSRDPDHESVHKPTNQHPLRNYLRRDRWFIQSPAKYFWKVPVLIETDSTEDLPEGPV